MSETPQQPIALKTLQQSSKGKELVGKSRQSGDKLKGLSNPVGGSNAKLTKFFGAAEKGTKTGQTDKKASKDVEEEESLTVESSILRDTGNQQRKSADKPECPRCSRSNIVQMLIGSAPNEKYWELVAEERRLALQEALRENMGIYEEIAALREENRQLRFLADEGLKYADLLKEVLKADEEEESQ